MKISELFRRLSIGELSNLSMSNDGNGTIVEAKRSQVLLYASNALERLHSRFVLRLDEADVVVVAGERDYVLEDAIKILTVWDMHGMEFPLNVRGDRWSMLTPSPNKLRVPAVLVPQTLTVEFQAKAEPIVQETIDLEFEIDIPEVLYPALTAYIAYEVYRAMNGKEHAAIAAGHRDRFEELCAEVELKDVLSVERTGKFSKFDMRGWA